MTNHNKYIEFSVKSKKYKGKEGEFEEKRMRIT
jgi:hypothetical protein